MNIITSTNNFISNNWLVEISQPIYTYADLSIGFTNNQPVVYFNNLRFGFRLTSSLDNYEKTYPQTNITYNSTDEPYLVVERLSLTENTEYHLNLWCENNGVYCETTKTFTTDILPPDPTPTPKPTPTISGSTF